MIERIAHDVSYLSAVYGADRLAVKGNERDRVLALLFDLVYSSLLAYIDLEGTERINVAPSEN